jgi:UDP-glucose 4-epimerase
MGRPTATHRAPSPAEAKAPVLVVGAGYIGRNMVRGLARDRAVSLLARRVPPASVRDVARVHIGDARDPAPVRAALEGVEHVVWCAGGLLPSEAEERPAYDAAATLEPLRTMLDLVAGRAISVTYMSSGGTVYGNPSTVPVAEDAPTRPVGEYGRVRLRAESLVLRAGEGAGTSVRVLRCSNVYGGDQPADRAQGAAAVFVDRVRRGAEIVLYGGGAAVRDFVHIDDVVRATGDVLPLAGPAVLNVGSGRGTSIAELLALVERSLGRRAIVVHRPQRPFDVERIVLDIARLQQVIAFAPRTLESGVAALVRACQVAS